MPISRGRFVEPAPFCVRVTNVVVTCLRGARHREGLTQRQLAEQTGIPQRHISEMENNKRSIGKNRAKILARALNTAGYRVFL